MRPNFFNFKYIDDEVLLTNDFGEYIFVNHTDFRSIVECKLDRDSELSKSLVEKRFCYYDTDLDLVQKNKIALREVKGYVTLATSLHIFVVTTACNMKCVYCQLNYHMNNKVPMNWIFGNSKCKKSFLHQKSHI